MAPSPILLSKAGMEAIQAKDWDKAITSLSAAIRESKSPAWMLARSNAYMQRGNLAKALIDAEAAYHAAIQRGNDKSRKQMIEAQYRRAVVYLRMKRYADSDCCAVWSQQLAKGASASAEDTVSTNVDENGEYKATLAEAMAEKWSEKETDEMERLKVAMGSSSSSGQSDWNKAWTWRSQALARMEELPKGDPGRKVSVSRIPAKPSMQEVDDIGAVTHDNKIEAKEKQATVPPVQTNPKTEPTNSKFRTQMYQSDGSINVTLFMKFPSQEATSEVQVYFQPNLITITGVPREPSTVYLVPHAAIDPDACSSRVATMKIEFTLKKVVPAKWAIWGTEQLAKPDSSVVAEPASTIFPTVEPATVQEDGKLTTASASGKAPAYPTSSKSGPKNWDSLDVADDDKEDDDVNSFFKKIYKNADPDMQRAMMKSFTESNGTSLSTDWGEVSKGKVETMPPDGVEAKKWSS